MRQNENDDVLENTLCFPTIVYSVQKPEFLENVRKIALAALSKEEKLSEIYPVRMSPDIAQDPEIQDFCHYAALTALNILREQGYNVTNKAAFFTEMWCQEHHKFSQMDQHIHSNGAQIVGFYFLDTPEDGCMATFHDPRAGKTQLGLAEFDMARVTYASNAFQLKPEPGALVLTNAWLPHSFTKNGSSRPFRFVHFNIGLVENPQAVCEVEIL
jgi:hypothetical protein